MKLEMIGQTIQTPNFTHETRVIEFCLEINTFEIYYLFITCYYYSETVEMIMNSSLKLSQRQSFE